MFSFINELTHSMRNNKLRTAVTSFAIAWGIFMLIILLGIGTGIETGIGDTVKNLGRSDRMLIVLLYKTQLPYAGYKQGRELFLTDRELEGLYDFYKSRVIGIEAYGNDYMTIGSKDGEVTSPVTSLSPLEQSFNKVQVVQGRIFTHKEQADGRNVILISEREKSKLFPRTLEVEGESVVIRGLVFTVVGVVKDIDVMAASYYIPLKSYKAISPNTFTKSSNFYVFPKSSLSNKQIETLIEDLRIDLKAMKRVAPSDDSIEISNLEAVDSTLHMAFIAIRGQMWFIGISILMIGIIGVSNVMQVTVRERMREIGIRKALGAKPRNIMGLVLGESIFLSLISGIIGLLVGIGVLKLISILSHTYGWGTQMIGLGNSSEKLTVFQDPHINMPTAISALVVLIVAGVIAGYSPARNAIKVPAVIAMRDMK